MGNILNTLILHPLLNLMVFFTWLVPGHNAFWGIVLVTLLVRFILLIPSRNAAKSQRKMNEMQPLLEELKKEYANDKQGLATAQMELYKQNNINPFASCLPLVIQLPILWFLYRAIIEISLSAPGLYAWLPKPAHMATQFFWADLLKPDPIYLIPILAAVLQYFQVKMTLPKMGPKVPGQQMDPSIAMQRNMVYISPAMTLLIAGRLPAGAAVYWVVQAAFSIVQQIPIYKEKLKLKGLTEVMETAEALHPERTKQAEAVLKELKPLEEKSSNKNGVSVTVRRKKSSKYTAGE